MNLDEALLYVAIGYILIRMAYHWDRTLNALSNMLEGIIETPKKIVEFIREISDPKVFVNVLVALAGISMLFFGLYYIIPYILQRILAFLQQFGLFS